MRFRVAFISMRIGGWGRSSVWTSKEGKASASKESLGAILYAKAG